MDLMACLTGFGKLANELAELLQQLSGERRRRNNEVAAYFEELAAAMVKVVKGLRTNQVPRSLVSMATKYKL